MFVYLFLVKYISFVTPSGNPTGSYLPRLPRLRPILNRLKFILSYFLIRVTREAGLALGQFMAAVDSRHC